MLGQKTAIATIGVKDIEVAARFYEDILGFTRSFADENGVLYQSGASQVFVYVSA